MINIERLLTLLASEGFDPSLVEEDTEAIICCPICDDDRARLYISTENGAWNCFHCHEDGGLHRFLMVVLDKAGPEAFELTRELTVDESADDYLDYQPRQEKKVETAVLNLPAQFRRIEEAPPAFVKYLENRGVSAALASARGIGFASTGRYAGRVIVPVSMDGQLYTYIARTTLKHCPNCTEKLDDCTCRPTKFPKVLTPRSADGARPSHAIYNFDAVAASSAARIVVVEGVFDALRLPSEAVAIMGSSASPIQRTLIGGLARGRECILALDADEAGFKGAVKLAEALTSDMIKVRVAVLPDGSDPGQLTQEELRECLRQAKRYVL
jgi:DNA primase